MIHFSFVLCRTAYYHGHLVFQVHRLSTLIFTDIKMNVGVAYSDSNPTHSYFNSKGIWLTYVLLVFGVHLLLLSVPFFSVAVAWTLTNVLHDVVSFF